MHDSDLALSPGLSPGEAYSTFLPGVSALRLMELIGCQGNVNNSVKMSAVNLFAWRCHSTLILSYY